MEKIKCLYFLQFWPLGRDMGTFVIIKGTFFLSAPTNLKLTLNMVAIPEIKLKSPNIFLLGCYDTKTCPPGFYLHINEKKFFWNTLMMNQNYIAKLLVKDIWTFQFPEYQISESFPLPFAPSLSRALDCLPEQTNFSYCLFDKKHFSFNKTEIKIWIENHWLKHVFLLLILAIGI